MNGGALAFIGDAVYELWIREYLIKSGNTVLEKLNAEKVKFVSQTAQLEAVNKLLPFFTEEELSIYHQGRNFKYKNRKESYIKASGLEAVIGFLYLNKRSDRIDELMEKIVRWIYE